MPRKSARRIAYGKDILFGIAGSSLAFSLKPRDIARIEAFYGRKAELLKEAEVVTAMSTLHIKQVPLDAAEQAQLDQIDLLEAEKIASSETPTPQSAPSPVQETFFCTNCGARVNKRARFCESCGTQLFF